MNTPTPLRPCARVLRPLLAACLFLTALLPLRAENLQSLEIRIDPARAAHAFGLSIDGGAPFAVENYGLHESDWPDLALTFSTLFANAVDLDQPITLFDLTAGDSTTLTLSAEANGPAWGLGPWVSPDPLTLQYFLLPAARRGHALWLAQADNVFLPVTQADFLGTVEWSALGLYDPAARFEAWAQRGPGWFRLFDATTDEMAGYDQTDLVVGQWAGAGFTSPVGGLTIYLEGENVGRSFTVHARAPGGFGPEFRQSLLPTVDPWLVNHPDAAANGGYWTYDHDGNWVFIPASSVCLSGSMGFGMEFWVTRDDTPEAETPHLIYQPPTGAPSPFWLALGLLPPPPPPLQSIPIRIPMNGTGWAPGRFTVHQSGGAIREVELGSYEYLWSYDYYGQLDGNTLWIANATATVDDSRDWWLVDSLTGQTHPLRTGDLCADWHPTFAARPQGIVHLSIYGDRQGHTLHLMDGEAGPSPRPARLGQSMGPLAIMRSASWKATPCRA